MTASATRGENVNFVRWNNLRLFAPASYYKQNKGYFLGFLFKPLGGLRPPRGLNEKTSEKYPLFITYSLHDQRPTLELLKAQSKFLIFLSYLSTR